MSTSNSHSINGNYSCRRRSIDGSFTSSIKSEEAVPLMNSANYSVSSIDSEDDDRLSYISMDVTAEAIKQCEKFFLRPYSNALKLIGWLPYNSKIGGLIWQIILVCLWGLCITATMVTQVMSCFKRDGLIFNKTVIETTEIPIFTALPHTSMNTTITPYTIGQSQHFISCDEHIISSLLLLDPVVLFMYFFGFYIFSQGETEYLFGLASNVFIKNFEAKSSSNRLIATIGILFVCGIMWIVFSFVIRIMTAVAVEMFVGEVYIQWSFFTVGGNNKIALVIFSLFGFFTVDMIYMFSIMNYVAQGEMNIYLLWDVRRLIQTKSYKSIDAAIKDVQKCKRYLDVLNGKTAALTALTLFVVGNLAVSALIDLNNIDESSIKEDFRILAGISSFLNVVCWFSLVSLPFIQAARVTYWCDQLKDIGPEIRGRVWAMYMDTPLLDLESLLSFLQAVKLRASILGVPVHPWVLYLILTLMSLIMLVLLQTDAYNVGKYI